MRIIAFIEDQQIVKKILQHNSAFSIHPLRKSNFLSLSVAVLEYWRVGWNPYRGIWMVFWTLRQYVHLRLEWTGSKTNSICECNIFWIPGYVVPLLHHSNTPVLLWFKPRAFSGGDPKPGPLDPNSLLTPMKLFGFVFKLPALSVRPAGMRWF